MQTRSQTAMATSAAQRRLSACWPLHTQRRLCSTLAHLQSALRTVRQAKRLEGGTLRLSISEDLRVLVEHQAASDSAAVAVAMWQGESTCTLREALRHLHASQEAETQPTPPTPSTTTAPRQRTLLNGTNGHSEDVQHAMSYLARSYPQVQLKVQHTSGVDLLGAKLHTISVRLEPRGLGVAVESLPAEQQRLVKKFDGESVGDTYTGCLRRALKEACAAVGLSYDAISVETAARQSVLSLYAQLWTGDGFELRLEPLDTIEGATTAAAVSLALKHASTGRTLASTFVSLTPDGLRGVLDFCDKIAAEHYRGGHAALHARLRAAPLYLVLPRTRLDARRLLTKLLVFHYGVDAADVRVQVRMSKCHMYSVEVHGSLSSLPATNESGGCAAPPFKLGSAQGISKVAAVDAAMVQAIRALFPDIYAREIAYHPDIKAIVESERVSVTGAEQQPCASHGLVAQLQWALRREFATHVVELRLLKHQTAFPDIGIATGHASVWQAKVFLQLPAAPDATAAPQELVACAYDQRKSRSEQKAVAAALAKRYPQLCEASIALARSRNLIDASGAPTPCPVLQQLKGTGISTCAAAQAADPFLAALDLQQARATQPLPATHTGDSVLEKYWAATQTEASLLGSVCVGREPGGSTYAARCTRADTTAADAQEHVLASATALSEISALLALFKEMQSVPEVVPADAAATLVATLADVAAAAPPRLPPGTPLQTCAVTMAQLYGLACSVLVRHMDSGWEADLFGVVPAGSALATPHPRLAQSPFTADRNFFLGRGRGDSAATAVVRSAQQAYELHVRVHQRAFAGEPVMSGEVRLTPEPQSRLARLCDGVLAEIKAVSQRNVEESALTLRWTQEEGCRMYFSVTADAKAVVLEDASGTNVLACARELCKHIAAETGGAFLSPATLAEMRPNTPEALLGELCRTAYGAALETGLNVRKDAWHCRLCLPLTTDVHYCMVEASATRKRDAVDAACVAALQTYFAEELPHVGIAFASPAEESTAVKVNCDAYAFRVDEAAQPG